MFYKNAFLSALIATIISVLLSVSVTYAIQYANGVRIIGMGVAIAVIVPLIVAPLGSYPYFRAHFELLKLKQELEIISRTDSLTGLYNRRAFWELSTRALAQSKAREAPISLLLIDVDHFKRVNDSWGHLVGDRVLHEISQRLSQCLTRDEVLARFGGEEFILLLPQMDLMQATAMAICLHQEVAGVPISTESGDVSVTVSAGIATDEKPPYDLSDLIRRADRALYAAKARGRNQFVIDEAAEQKYLSTTAG